MMIPATSPTPPISPKTSTTNTSHIDLNDSTDKLNYDNQSSTLPPAPSTSANIAITYLRQSEVVREAAAMSHVAEYSIPSIPPLDLTKEDDSVREIGKEFPYNVLMMRM